MEKVRRKHNIVEKITFFIGLLLLAAIFGFLIYDLLQDDHHYPPQLEISTTLDPQVRPYGYRVIVKNTSKQTAQDAEIDFALYQHGEEVENATASFMFLPAKSQKTAWIVFYTERKQTDSVVVRATTYIKP